MAHYYVENYPPDGHQPGPDAIRRSEHATLAAARREVRRRLGLGPAAARARRWDLSHSRSDSMEPVEAYHELLASDQRAYGCGGVAILRDAPPDTSELLAELRADYDVY